MRKRRRLSRWPPAAVSVPTEPKWRPKRGEGEKKRVQREENGERRGRDRARKRRKDEDSPGSNKPAEVEVTLKLLHG